MIIKKILLRIWAYLPIFALTDDLGFLDAIPDAEDHEYYLSLINILFGEIKYQFMSFPIKQPEKKIVIFRSKRLSEMKRFALSVEKRNELEENYKKHYNLLRDCERSIEKEELVRKLSEQQARIDTSYNKINAFTTIILAIIPIIITLADKEKMASLNNIEIIVFVILLYAIINLCTWIFQAINVRGFNTSKFSDLKKSMNKGKEQNWQIYYDWQETKRKADMFVSFVIYIKQWIITVIILMTIFSVGIPINKTENSKVINDKVYTLQIENIEKTYDKSAVKWYSVLEKLQEAECKRIVILYNEADIAVIKEKLEPYNKQKIVWIKDETLNKNQIKIILEK